LFLYAVVVTVQRRARAHTAATPGAVLGARALAVFVVVLGSFALIHSEARHMMPVIPAFLIVTALAVRRPRAT
jgi:protein-S-isoprenylcysteine O-methyltransferase Ste14